MEFLLIDLHIVNGHHGESLLERVGYGDNSHHVVLPHPGDSPADNYPTMSLCFAGRGLWCRMLPVFEDHPHSVGLVTIMNTMITAMTASRIPSRVARAVNV